MYTISNQSNKISSSLLALCIIAFNLQNGFTEILCAITSLYGLSIAIKAKETHIFKSSIFYLILTLWIYLIIVSAISAYPLNAINNALPALRLPLFSLAVGYMLYAHKQILPSLLIFTSLTALFVSINAIIQFNLGTDLFGNEFFTNDTIIRLTNLHGKLQVGYILSTLSAPIAGYLLSLIKAEYRNKLLIAYTSTCLLVMLIAVLLSGERAPLILITCTLLILSVFSLPLKHLTPLLLACTLSTCLYVNHNPKIKYRLIDNTVIDTKDFFQSSSYGMIYSNAFEIIKNHNPIYGSGAKSFKQLCDSIEAPFPQYCSNHTHNLYLELLVAGGIPAIIISIAIVVLAFKNMIMYISKNRSNYIYIACASYVAVKLLPVIPAPSVYIAWASYPIAFLCGILVSFHINLKRKMT